LCGRLSLCLFGGFVQGLHIHGLQAREAVSKGAPIKSKKKKKIDRDLLCLCVREEDAQNGPCLIAVQEGAQKVLSWVRMSAGVMAARTSLSAVFTAMAFGTK
jgi:hypothetical protein